MSGPFLSIEAEDIVAGRNSPCAVLRKRVNAAHIDHRLILFVEVFLVDLDILEVAPGIVQLVVLVKGCSFAYDPAESVRREVDGVKCRSSVFRSFLPAPA